MASDSSDQRRRDDRYDRRHHHHRDGDRSFTRHRETMHGDGSPGSDLHARDHTSHRHRSHRHRDKSADRSRSPHRRSDHRRRRSHSRSRHDSDRKSRHPSQRPKRLLSRSPPPSEDALDPRRSRKPLPSQEDSYRGETGGAVAEEKPKEKPNFKASGLLAAESNKITIGAGPNAKHITLKYHEPPEARKPPASQPWRMFVFETGKEDPLETIDLYKRSCWLIGSDKTVTDLPIDDPSCSKQHAVFQFRFTSKTDEYGDKKSKVALYLLDLESAAGTYLNGKRIDVARYVQCLSGDVVQVGKSLQEFVIMLPPKG